MDNPHPNKRLNIAVIGSGISGLSSAWLLSQHHQVTLFEKDDRFGGHSNTVEVSTAEGNIPVDTGFIVYNPVNYPNLVRLFEHLQVPVQATEMSFAVSMDQGDLEYSGSGLLGLFAQKRNLLRPRFWRMVADIMRFYREMEQVDLDSLKTMSLQQLLDAGGYTDAFRDQHLLPMGAAIWSTPTDQMLQYPASAFIQFCQNHGLLQLQNRPQWHTVTGGSREYVSRLCAQIDGELCTNRAVRSVRRLGGRAIITDRQGGEWIFDHVVFACHADQTLKLLEDPRPEELNVLQPFRFERNRALLHSDTQLLPQHRSAWASWNYLSRKPTEQEREGNAEIGNKVCVSYWMNRLQNLPTATPLIVTLNPIEEPAEGSVHASFLYDHPVFDSNTYQAQRQLWDIQGNHNTWFCGAWCGYGFHEDGIQSGLLVAERLGNCLRPWQTADMNGRIPLPDSWFNQPRKHRAA